MASNPQQSPTDSIACNNCGTPNPSGHKFCMSCGTQLAAVISPSGPNMTPTNASQHSIARPPNKPFAKNTVLLVGGALLLLLILFFGFRVLRSGINSSKLQDVIVGKWVAHLGEVNGLGDIYEAIEFFKDGTATSRTDVTNFVGTYKFIADDTIRIDWKEQGVVGNSPIQIFKVRLDGDKLVMVNDATGRAIEYLRLDAVVQTATSPKQIPQATSVSAPQTIGKWELNTIGIERMLSDKDNVFVEFNPDGTFRRSEESPSGQVLQESVVEGTYEFIGGNFIQVNIKSGQWLGSSTANPLTLQFDFPQNIGGQTLALYKMELGSGKVGAIIGNYNRVK